jgi:hypothetical protein
LGTSKTVDCDSEDDSDLRELDRELPPPPKLYIYPSNMNQNGSTDAGTQGGNGDGEKSEKTGAAKHVKPVIVMSRDFLKPAAQGGNLDNPKWLKTIFECVEAAPAKGEVVGPNSKNSKSTNRTANSKKKKSKQTASSVTSTGEKETGKETSASVASARDESSFSGLFDNASSEIISSEAIVASSSVSTDNGSVSEVASDETSSLLARCRLLNTDKKIPVAKQEELKKFFEECQNYGIHSSGYQNALHKVWLHILPLRSVSPICAICLIQSQRCGRQLGTALTLTTRIIMN